MKIMVSGSEGFIGTHVRERLKDHEIIRVDCLEPRVHKEFVDSWTMPGGIRRSKEIDYITRVGDLYSEELEGLDTLVHLGAQVGVADSMDDPMRYYRDNTADTLKLLMRLSTVKDKPKRIVVASSMSVYGDPETKMPVYEDHPIRTASVYGLTKFDQERLCLMYGKMWGIPVTAFRFFNVYGPGQALHNPYTGVLAIFANALLNDIPPTVYEDGKQTRDFVHVYDIADAVAEAATSDYQGVYNLCTGRPTTIEEVALLLADALGKDIKPNITNTERPGDIRHCIGSNLRWKLKMVEWNPRSFAVGVKEYAKTLLDG